MWKVLGALVCVFFLLSCSAKREGASSFEKVPEVAQKPERASKGLSIPGRPRNPIFLDLDGDSREELAIVTKTPWLWIFKKSHQGFRLWKRFQVSTHNTWLVVADLNLDGRPDLVPLTEALLGPIVLNQGEGNFSVTKKSFRGPRFGYGAVAADLDQDGLVDIAAVGIQDQRLFLYWNEGDLNFTEEKLSPPRAESYFGSTPGMREIRVVDFNSDGFPDLLIADYFGKRVLLFQNKGRRKFSWRVLYASPEEGTVASVFSLDRDHDGDQDLVVAVESLGKLLFLKQEGGKFLEEKVLTVEKGFPRKIVPGRGKEFAVVWIQPKGSRVQIFEGEREKGVLFFPRRRCEYGLLRADHFWCMDLYHDELVKAPLPQEPLQ